MRNHACLWRLLLVGLATVIAAPSSAEAPDLFQSAPGPEAPKPKLRRLPPREIEPAPAAVVPPAPIAVVPPAPTASPGTRYGAVALEEVSGKYGFGWNEETQRRAEEAALRACNSAGCKVVFAVPPRRCGALATGDGVTAWGGRVDATRDAANLGALESCRKRTAGKCFLRGSDCNR